jgi:large subunit ribosomal protein L22
MTGPKTNERPGTRATLKGFHMSASKARVVLNNIRGQDVTSAAEILAGTTREAADVIAKVLASAVANAVNNDGMNADELFVSAAYADEGITMKRFTPRARGRAGKIRKRSCHITVIVSRLDEERLEMLRVARSAQAAASRSRRVASSRRRGEPVPAPVYEAPTEVLENDVVESDIVVTTEAVSAPIDAEPIEETLNEETVGEANEDETVSENTTEETK